ncbi:MAG: hypothetical protein ACI82A_002063 [Candidatus Azotimanducaceae bacterium]|jgi:hypothetical protein
MDAVVEGWSKDRALGNINFARWDDELETPFVELRERFSIQVAA